MITTKKIKLPNHQSLRYIFFKQMHQEIYFQQLHLTVAKHLLTDDCNADAISVHGMYYGRQCPHRG